MMGLLLIVAMVVTVATILFFFIMIVVAVPVVVPMPMIMILSMGMNMLLNMIINLNALNMLRSNHGQVQEHLRIYLVILTFIIKSLKVVKASVHLVAWASDHVQ